MSNSYWVTVYGNDNANVIGIFAPSYIREPKWIRGCCTLTVIADGIDEAIEKAKKVVKGEVEKQMSKLDEVIESVACILDHLVTCRDILSTGSCNTCEIKSTCQYCPKPGQIARFNCPFYKGEENNDNQV